MRCFRYERKKRFQTGTTTVAEAWISQYENVIWCASACIYTWCLICHRAQFTLALTCIMHEPISAINEQSALLMFWRLLSMFDPHFFSLLNYRIYCSMFHRAPHTTNSQRWIISFRCAAVCDAAIISGFKQIMEGKKNPLSRTNTMTLIQRESKEQIKQYTSFVYLRCLLFQHCAFA